MEYKTSKNNNNDDDNNSVQTVSSKESSSTAEVLPGADHLPNSLFSHHHHKSGNGIVVPTQPIALRTAMKYVPNLTVLKPFLST